ncbi:MAG: hypothetical protein Q8P67_05035, partial [archaeon]|nr:hypothetical protein [archaeon]
FLASTRADPAWFDGKTQLLELGSGTGLAGIVAAARGALITLTDLPNVLPLLRHNLQLNGLSSDPTAVAELTWGSTALTGWRADLLLGADLTYELEDIPLLMGVISHFCSPRPEGSGASFILAYGEERYVTGVFFEQLAAEGYSISHLDAAGLLQAAYDSPRLRELVVSDWTIKIAQISR